MLHHTNRCFLCSNGYPTRQSREKNHSTIWQGRILWTSKGCAGSVITISPHSQCSAITEIWKAFHEKEQTSRNLGSKEWSVLCFISNRFSSTARYERQRNWDSICKTRDFYSSELATSCAEWNATEAQNTDNLLWTPTPLEFGIRSRKQWVRALACKPKDFSLIPKTYMVEVKKSTPTSYLLVSTHWL